MKYKAIWMVPLLFFVGILTANSAKQNFSSRSANSIRIKPARKDLRVGERFEYLVRWMGIPIGYATLEIKEIVKINGRDAYHIIGTAKSNEFLSAFYKVDDVVHSYMDVERMCSLRFEKKQLEGRYRADERVIFDQDLHKGFYESFLNKSKKEFDIPPGVHDLASAFYYFRTLDVKPGQTIVIDINADEKNWKAKMKILRTERIELLRKGVYDVFVVEPKAGFKGVIAKRSRAWVYFSVDEERFPVFIKIRIPFGFVVGILEKKL